MRNKRGQFYLVAAIVIIAVIIGLAAVSNYVKRTPKVTVYDLEEELNIESPEVLQYGVFNYGADNEGLSDLLGNFTELYTDYAGDNKELYFIYGNQSGVRIIRYSDVYSGSLSYETSTLKVKGKFVEEETRIPYQGKINITIAGTNHEFVLNEGENFYYLISEDVENEKYIVSSQ